MRGGLLKHIRLLRASLFVTACAGIGSCQPAATDSEASGAGAWSPGHQPVVSIGEIDGSEPFIFSEVAGVRLMSDSRVAVADRSSGTIRVFSLDGQHLRTFGGVGGGPGEFQYMNSLEYRAPDTLVAYDSSTPRVTAFLASGSLETTVPLRATDGRPEVYLGTSESGLHAGAWIIQGPRDRSVVTPDQMQVGIFDASGQLLERIHSAPGMRRFANGPLPFSPHFVGLMLGDSLFMTDGLGGVIQVRGVSGGGLRSFRAEIEPQSLDEAWSRLDAALDSTRAAMFPDVSGHPAADSIPVISEMLSDDRGRLWLKRYDAATDSHWLGRPRTGGEWMVITTSGGMVATFTAPSRFKVMDVRGGHVAGVTVDELGVERVQVFEILGGTPDS